MSTSEKTNNYSAQSDMASASLAQILLDSTPLMCAMWDDKGKLIDCNMEMLRLLKISNKADVMGHFFDYSPPQQADGLKSTEKGMALIKEALRTGHQNFEWEYQSSDGECVPTETSLVRIKWEDGFRILAYSRDVRELNKMKEQKKLTEERTSAMLNTLPLATYLIADNLQLIDCNEAAMRLFRAKDKEHIISKFLEDFSPQYQADGELSSKKAHNYMQQAFEDGHIDFEWTHQAPNGELIPTQITLIRVPWHNHGYILSACAQDLRNIKKAEQEMRQREAYLRTVNTVSEWLLSANPGTAEEQIEKALEYLGHSMNLGGIKIWMNTEQDGELFYAMYKSWPVEEAANWPDRYSYNLLPFWKDSMLDNRSINSFSSDLPRAEQARLTKWGIKSVLAIPLHIENNLWGFISFEDYEAQRVFTDAEENMLRSSSSLIVSTIVRNRAVHQMLKNNWELRKKSLLLSSVNRVAELILGSEKNDFPLIIQRALKLLGESVTANRASLWVLHNKPDAPMYCSRLTGWQRGKAFNESNHHLAMKLLDFVPEWDVPIEELMDIEHPIAEMNMQLKRLAILRGAKTLLLIPLVLQEKFWGFVGFAFTESDHRSTDEEHSILRSGSMMIAEALIRQEVTDTLERVEVKAATDHLTGLLTRASFMPKSLPLFAGSKDNGTPFSVLFLDIDHFKKANDQYGHAFGDEVLVRFAEIVRSMTRPDDLCCRYGGEEVVVVLADSTPEIAQKVGLRIIQKVRNAKFDNEKDFSFTVSIGLISAVPQKDDQLQTFLEMADLALYAAKNQGRDRMIDYALLET